MWLSEQGDSAHQLTTHAHEGAAGKALERAHHTASPATSAARKKGSADPVQRRRACKTLYAIESGDRHIVWRKRKVML